MDDNLKKTRMNSARKRSRLMGWWYYRLAWWSCMSIAVALVLRYGGLSMYEGVITATGVFCAFMAGVLAAHRPQD